VAESSCCNRRRACLATLRSAFDKGLRQQLLNLIAKRARSVTPARQIDVTSDPDDNIFLEYTSKRAFLIPPIAAGSSERLYLSLEGRRDSLAMETLTHQTCLPLSGGPKCVSLKRELSTVRCERPTASASARSRSSGGHLALRALINQIRTRRPRMETTALFSP
jgi:hypothetical protein